MEQAGLPGYKQDVEALNKFECCQYRVPNQQKIMRQLQRYLGKQKTKSKLPDVTQMFQFSLINGIALDKDDRNKLMKHFYKEVDM